MKFNIALVLTLASINLYGRGAYLSSFKDNTIISKIMRSFVAGSALVVIGCNNISCSPSSHMPDDTQQLGGIAPPAPSRPFDMETTAEPIADHPDIGAFTLHVGNEPGVKYLLGKVQQVYTDDVYAIEIIATIDFGDSTTHLVDTYQLSIKRKTPFEHGGFLIGTMSKQEQQQ